VIAGYGHSASGIEGFRWTAIDGLDGLGDLPGGDFYSTGRGISADGSVLVGNSNSTNGYEAFRWEGGVMVGLGDLLGGSFESRAEAVSADGSIVVGFGSTALGYESFLWDSVNGMRNLQTVLTSDYGLDLTGWTLSEASSISADGMQIVGFGLHNGNIEGWYADLSSSAVPEPSSFVLVAGLAGCAWWRRRHDRRKQMLRRRLENVRCRA
jgi:probable HAF family extracellular repeat protein